MADGNVEVRRDWLIFVDSITSLVAYRYSKGLDEETVRDLKEISHVARTLAQSGRAKGGDQ